MTYAVIALATLWLIIVALKSGRAQGLVSAINGQVTVA